MVLVVKTIRVSNMDQSAEKEYRRKAYLTDLLELHAIWKGTTLDKTHWNGPLLSKASHSTDYVNTVHKAFNEYLTKVNTYYTKQEVIKPNIRLHSLVENTTPEGVERQIVDLLKEFNGKLQYYEYVNKKQLDDKYRNDKINKIKDWIRTWEVSRSVSDGKGKPNQSNVIQTQQQQNNDKQYKDQQVACFQTLSERTAELQKEREKNTTLAGRELKYHQELDQCNHKLDEQEKQFHASIQEWDRSTKQMKDTHRSTVLKLEEQIAALRSDLKTSNNKYEKISQDISLIGLQQIDTKNDNKQKTNRITELEQRLQTTTKDNMAQIASLRQSVEHWQNNYEEARKETTQVGLDLELANKTIRNNESAQKVKTLEQTIRNQVQQMERLELEITDLKTHLRIADETIKEGSTTNRLQSSTTQEDTMKLQEKCQRMSATVTDLESKHKNNQAVIDQLTISKQQIEQQNTTLRAANTKLSSDMQELKETLTEIRNVQSETTKEHQIEIDNIHANYTSALVNKTRELKDTRKECDDQLQAVKRELDTKNQSYASLSTQLNRTEAPREQTHRDTIHKQLRTDVIEEPQSDTTNRITRGILIKILQLVPKDNTPVDINTDGMLRTIDNKLDDVVEQLQWLHKFVWKIMALLEPEWKLEYSTIINNTWLQSLVKTIDTSISNQTRLLLNIATSLPEHRTLSDHASQNELKVFIVEKIREMKTKIDTLSEAQEKYPGRKNSVRERQSVEESQSTKMFNSKLMDMLESTHNILRKNQPADKEKDENILIDLLQRDLQNIVASLTGNNQTIDIMTQIIVKIITNITPNKNTKSLNLNYDVLNKLNGEIGTLFDQFVQRITTSERQAIIREVYKEVTDSVGPLLVETDNQLDMKQAAIESIKRMKTNMFDTYKMLRKTHGLKADLRQSHTEIQNLIQSDIALLYNNLIETKKESNEAHQNNDNHKKQLGTILLNLASVLKTNNSNTSQKTDLQLYGDIEKHIQNISELIDLFVTFIQKTMKHIKTSFKPDKQNITDTKTIRFLNANMERYMNDVKKKDAYSHVDESMTNKIDALFTFIDQLLRALNITYEGTIPIGRKIQTKMDVIPMLDILKPQIQHLLQSSKIGMQHNEYLIQQSRDQKEKETTQRRSRPHNIETGMQHEEYMKQQIQEQKIQRQMEVQILKSTIKTIQETNNKRKRSSDSVCDRIVVQSDVSNLRSYRHAPQSSEQWKAL